MKGAQLYAAIVGRRDEHQYEPVPGNGMDQGHDEYINWEDTNIMKPSPKSRRRLFIIGMAIVGMLFLTYWATTGLGHSGSCDSVDNGFQCQPEISHFWGQYSPFFSVPSEIDPAIPEQCQITFAQVLSRHGARDPTASSTITYQELIQNIHNSTWSYSPEFEFLEDYNVTLGQDQLTTFGQQELVNSGIKFYERYNKLTRKTTPFIRASGQNRVVESAQNWTQGFHNAWLKDHSHISDDTYPYPILQIAEGSDSNNTLSIELCTNFNTDTEYAAQNIWISKFAPSITARVNYNLRGANLTDKDTFHLMDLCPFETVASETGQLSDFCYIFTEEEWKDYDYYQSIGKYYGYNWGNPLAPTQGVGFTNELIARMTNSPVNDHTSTNSTLDEDSDTFPIGKETKLYADFSHDNDMSMIFVAMGLYNETMPLQKDTRESLEEMNGFSAAATVSFGARVYFEKMSCKGEEEEFVRVVMNDRVLPLKSCGGDELGRCKLGDWVESLSYAREGGDWEKCFT